ncbi:FAD binding domain-containing protein [Scheffersomyces xylosifermentans]|uniref:FAD binding domain-containing protein n=1 Tax=Scheffersomyces xylosifermentans TaxID=1304137 RepID=UPI00315D45DF
MTSPRPSTIVVGTGLAGLTTTLQLLQHGHPVTLLEKTDRLGGNSIKASSGINGVPTVFQDKNSKDTVEAFIDDTLKSGKGLSNLELVQILATNSRGAIDWLTNSDELNIDLSSITQLGGHSYPRTHRGSGKLPPGFAIISALTKRLDKYAEDPSTGLKVIKNAKLDKLLLNSDTKVQGIEYVGENNSRVVLKSDNVVLATGGISADFETGSLIKKYRPDLLHLPSTNGKQTTGDGQKIAERDVSANLIHMDQIQVHPTGFIKLDSTTDKWKFLCGELIRGIGGILLSPKTGNRFTNELNTRDLVTNAIMDNCEVSKNNDLGIAPSSAVSVIVINLDDYLKAKDHIDFYASQKLLQRGGVSDLLGLLKRVNSELGLTVEQLVSNLQSYNAAIKNNQDALGRTKFGAKFNTDDEFFFGLTTPVLHFSMGGIEINKDGQVVTRDNKVVENLYAVGEVSGGLHGGNRLGGSSLLECVVFGKIVGDSIRNKAP